MLGLLIAANIGWAFYKFGSYQYIYFNTFTGGLPGGASHFGASEATDYWGSSYRQGIRWLNENAPTNAALHVPIADHIVDVAASIWLRSDIKVIAEDQLSSRDMQDRFGIRHVHHPPTL